MSVSSQGFPRRGNHLLSCLSDDAYTLIGPLLQLIPLKIKQVLHERGKAFSHIYFPCSAVISALLPMQDGAIIEVGNVGNEGISASEILTGANMSLHDYMCQIEGEAFRMTAPDFMQALERAPELRKLTGAYFQGYLAQITQSVACNSLHDLESRFARWSLLTHDRVQGDQFGLTQEFMAQMLGVHRPSVSLVANTFQRAGLIKYSRGTMEIKDRQGLEEATCECYFNVRAQFQSLLGIQYG